MLVECHLIRKSCSIMTLQLVKQKVVRLEDDSTEKRYYEDTKDTKSLWQFLRVFSVVS